jgi:cytochrome c biogenesis protein CcmG, thiol:disulfide interchange protein DsbE
MNVAALVQDTRRWYMLMAVVLALGAVWTFLARVPPAATTGGAPPPSAREGFLAPDFTLDLLGGEQVQLSDLRGKVVMVNLWASWCPPCRAEMPAIENVYRTYKDKGFEVLAINITYQDGEAEAAAFAQDYGLTFPILLDRTGAVSNRYLLRAMPSTFFIDRQGVIRSVVIGGPMSEAVIQSKVEELLKETS